MLTEIIRSMYSFLSLYLNLMCNKGGVDGLVTTCTIILFVCFYLFMCDFGGVDLFCFGMIMCFICLFD